MGEVIFCKTDDSSVGLYNSAVGDIYHSTYGAYSEAYEKFIEASGFIDNITVHDSVAILDICYGIGYNTKAALNEIIKSDRIIAAEIDALENDKKLIEISPLLKKQKINNLINEFIIHNSNIPNEMSIFGILKFFFKSHGLRYINITNLCRFKGFKFCLPILVNLCSKILAFQHNIYYNYISQRNKKGQKYSKLAKTSLVFHADDARRTVLSLTKKYNFIFLDAFTPKLLPTLWTVEFFKELFRLLDDDGILITYSSSAAVRSAMMKAGFFVGRSEDKNGKIIGTVAAKNEKLIKFKLSEFDEQLLQTKAGICYHDKNLCDSAENIISKRDADVKNSQRMTSSRLKKIWKTNTKIKI